MKGDKTIGYLNMTTLKLETWTLHEMQSGQWQATIGRRMTSKFATKRELVAWLKSNGQPIGRTVRFKA